MSNNPLDEGRISEDGRPVGTVTVDMVLARARELAIINGRSPHKVLDTDLEQARRELTGEGDKDPEEATIESLPESERWDPVPGSSGQQVPTVPLVDESVENEKLVQEGVDEAEHDQMLQGSEEAAKRDEGS
jgi:hypothetical protein